jgi:hypothetical protein
MRKWFTFLFPRAELAAKQRQIDTLMVSLKNASDKASDLQRKYEESLEREVAARKSECDALKAVANYAVLAGGSKVAIFDGAGPTMPHRESSPGQPVQTGPIQARKHIRNLHNLFAQQQAEWDQRFRQDLESATEEPTQ